MCVHTRGITFHDVRSSRDTRNRFLRSRRIYIYENSDPSRPSPLPTVLSASLALLLLRHLPRNPSVTPWKMWHSHRVLSPCTEWQQLLRFYVTRPLRSAPASAYSPKACTHTSSQASPTKRSRKSRAVSCRKLPFVLFLHESSE